MTPWSAVSSAWGTYRRATRPIRRARHVAAPVTHFSAEADAWAGGGRLPRLVRWGIIAWVLFYPFWLLGTPGAGEAPLDTAPGEHFFYPGPEGDLVAWSVCSPSSPDVAQPVTDPTGEPDAGVLAHMLDGVDKLAAEFLAAERAREYGEWTVTKVGGVVGYAADLFTGDADPSAEFTAWKDGVQSGDACMSPNVPAGPDTIPASSGSSSPGDNSWGGYANGRIPAPALRSLSTAPGHLARGDAAAAFDRMSTAYRARFGAPISVTDSYRTFESQVRLRAAKPGLAAVPGTSNHGWGVAFDLGGGIESFGTVEHEWMRTHAGEHGFIHPDWAQQNGSKPEAWHWQFAGDTTEA